MAEAENTENEKEYFTRVHLALTECGTDILRKLLLKRVNELTPNDHPSKPWALDEFLHYKMNEILSSIGKERHKKDILYPYRKDTNLKKWDISLFVHILFTACDLEANDNLHRQLKQDICNLRDLRNKMSHKQTHKLSKEIYQMYYGRIQGSILRICEYMQEPNLKDSLQKQLDHYECLGHVYVNGLISGIHKPLEVINEGDGCVESALQQIKSITEQKELAVNIPVLDVMLMFRNLIKDNEQAVSERLRELFSEALEKNEDTIDTSVQHHSLGIRDKLKNEVVTLVRKLFEEKRTIERVSTGCLILTIQCPDLDSVMALIQDSISGRLTDLFSPLEDVMQTDTSNERFDVYAGITKQSCWGLMNRLYCDVSTACQHSNFSIDCVMQQEGVSIRILKFFGSIEEKEHREKLILSNQKDEIRMQLTEKLEQYLSQPGLEMELVLQQNIDKDTDVETPFAAQRSDVHRESIEGSEKYRFTEAISGITTVPEFKHKPLDLKSKFEDEDASHIPLRRKNTMEELEMATGGEQNYHKDIKDMLTNCVTPVLKELLLKRVKELKPTEQPEGKWTVNLFLHQHKRQLLRCLRHEHLEDVLYPYIEDTNLDNWDFSAYVLVLLKTCELNESLQQCVINLDELSNKIQLCPDKKLSEAIRYAYQDRLRCRITQICNNLEDKGKTLLSRFEEQCQHSSRSNYPNSLAQTYLKDVQFVSQSDSDAITYLEWIESSQKRIGESPVIPEIEVLVILKHYNESDEIKVSRCIETAFDDAKKKYEATDLTSHDDDKVDAAVFESENVTENIHFFVKRLFEGRQKVTTVAAGCVKRTIQCKTIGAVTDLLDQSINGHLTAMLAPLKDEIRQSPGNELFDVKVGVTRESCWKMINELNN